MSNGARLYGLDPDATREGVSSDHITAMKREYHAKGIGRSNLSYGYVVD